VWAPASTCGVFAFLAFDAATLSGRRWTYAAGAAAFAAFVVSCAAIADSAVRAID